MDFLSLTSSVTLLVVFSHTSYSEALWQSGHISSRGQSKTLQALWHFTMPPSLSKLKHVSLGGTNRGHMEFPVKITKQQGALVTVEEAGVVVALAQASSGTQSLCGSSV